jgi:proline dehydrogenase
VQRAAARFLPGEDLEHALDATRKLSENKISAILTQLGENVSDTAESEAVTRHYLQGMDRIRESGLDAEVSIKPTHLGLDLSAEDCLKNVLTLAGRAGQLGKFLWIDMEGSAYTDRTLDIFRRVRAQHPKVGVCLQAYLYRTAKDLAELVPMGGGIRLVKGAYREPPEVAYPRKKDVDENYFRLTQQLLSPEARRSGIRAAFATHDVGLILRIQRAAEDASLTPSQVEFELLYGIQRAEQIRLAQAGYQVRVLISYGSEWFAWYIRRLAERPANVLFLARNLFS